MVSPQRKRRGAESRSGNLATPVTLTVRRRDGLVVSTKATLVADPRILVVPVEAAGVSPTPAQRAFRDAWLH